MFPSLNPPKSIVLKSVAEHAWISDLEILPLVFDPLHEFMEARLAADIGEEGVKFVQQWIVEYPLLYRPLQPS